MTLAPQAFLRLVGGLAFLAALAGCGKSPASMPDAGGVPACAAEFCGAYRCEPRLQRCPTDCGATADCIDGFACEGGACVGQECTAQTAVERCGGYACVLGRCSRDCALGPCTAGYYCRGDTGECQRKCTTAFDPVCSGYPCDLGSGECEPTCLAGSVECAPGYTCTSMLTCVR